MGMLLSSHIARSETTVARGQIYRTLTVSPQRLMKLREMASPLAWIHAGLDAAHPAPSSGQNGHSGHSGEMQGANAIMWPLTGPLQATKAAHALPFPLQGTAGGQVVGAAALQGPREQQQSSVRSCRLCYLGRFESRRQPIEP